MRDFLSTQYPRLTTPKAEFVGILGAGVFVVLFLLVFQPYGTQDFQSTYRELFLAGYGFICIIVFSLSYFVVPRVLPKIFAVPSWTAGKQLCWLLIIYLVTSVWWYLYWGWFFEAELSIRGWGRFLFLGLSVFIFPLAALFIYGYILQLKQGLPVNDDSAAPISPHPATGAEPESPGNVNQAMMLIPPSRYLFLRAARNYVEVNYEDAGSIHQLLYRSSLKSLQSSLGNPYLVQCHRSFFVNLHKVSEILDTPQGYRLKLAHSDTRVPVARSQVKSIRDKLASLAE